MWSTMIRFLAPPVFQDDPTKTHLAYLLNILILATCACTAGAYIILALAHPLPRASIIIGILSSLAFVGIWFIVRSGRTRLASTLFLLLAWALPTFGILQTGGLRSPVLSTLLVLIFLAGLLLGRPGLLAGWALSILSCLFSLLIEKHGLVTMPAAAPHPVLNLVVFIASFGLTTVLIYFSQRSQTRALDRARQELAERKHAEAERLKFQLGIERSADAIFLTDPAGKIVYVNPAFEKTYGYYRDDLRGKTPRVLKSGVHSQQFYEQFWRTLLSKEILAGEIVNRASDGRLLHIEGSANPIINDAGEITGFLAIHRDVTERKRSEELVLTIARGVSSATGESFFRSLVEQLGKALGADVVFVGELLKTNSARIRTLAVYSDGQIAENFQFELNGSPYERLLGEKQCSYPRGIRNLFPLDRMLAELKAEGYIGTSLSSSTGEAFGLMVMLFRQPVQNLLLAESILQIFAVRASAELDRKQTEEALQKSEERFRSLVQNSTDMITIQDATGTLLYVSPAGHRILGYKPGEFLGRNVFELVHPGDLTEVLRAFQQVCDRKDTGLPTEYRIRRADGSWIYLETIGTNQLDNPAIRGLVATSRDITERKRSEQALHESAEEKAKLEDRLRQAHKMETIGQLAGGVAHDFNNLLSPIMGYSEMLMSELPKDDPRHTKLSVIMGAAERAANLTRQLLSFSRKQMLDMKIIDLNRVLTDFERILHTTIREDVELTLRLGSDPGHFRGDVSQVEQIILNLASNAQDALPSGGKMVIETANTFADRRFCQAHPFVEPGPYVLLSFTDNGLGMDAETLKHIFEPFYTSKELGEGTGLGLATVYGVVKQHRGYIFVDSKPGRGSEFKIYLPRVEEPVDIKLAPSPGRSERHGSETVVVVEDNELVRNLASSVLKKNGYHVIALPGGEECLEMLEENEIPVDLLLTDVIMPRMNGRELYQLLSAKYPQLKVLFMSGYAGNVISYHGVLDEGLNFIQKPFSVQALASKVRELLER